MVVVVRVVVVIVRLFSNFDIFVSNNFIYCNNCVGFVIFFGVGIDEFKDFFVGFLMVVFVVVVMF